MDSQVKRIRLKDYELSAVQDNLAGSLQQVLDHLNQNTSSASSSQLTLAPLVKQPRGPGTAKSLQSPALLVHGDASASPGNSVVFGDVATATAAQVGCNVGIYGNLNVTGATTHNGDLTVNGNTVFRNRTDGGVCIVPLASTTAFYTTNAGNSAIQFSVSDNGSATSRGTVTANNFTSVVGGFKTHVNMGTQWRQTGQGGVFRSVSPLSRTDTNGSTSTVCAHVMPFAGSIVGIDFVLDRTIAADITVQVFKNTLLTTGQIIDVMGIKAGYSTPLGPITFAKGTYPFNAGDYLGMGCYVGTGYTFAANFGLVVEYGA
jgi:hypothetical protein